MLASNPSDIARAAHSYAARGWSVVPVEPRGKRPVVAWQALQQRIATPDEIAAWFRRWPGANIGVVTGSVSGLVVIDVDPRHDGEASFARLCAARASLPPTIEARTGGGGRHLYFAHPGGVIRNRVGLAPGIDLRGDGGCVVAPPSIHPSGGRYAWVPARGPDEVAPAHMPAWLARLAGDGAARAGHSLEHWRELARAGVAAGVRNDTIAAFAGHLLRHDVDPEVVLELLLAWNRARCDPPLPDAEVARTVRSIVRMHE